MTADVVDVATLEGRYLALLRSGTRAPPDAQGALVELRNAIAAATGRGEQDVQDDFEARAAGLA
jgi:hypothetical protein